MSVSICTYCGNDLVDPENPEVTFIALSVTVRQKGKETKRLVCWQCLIKALDKVLGEPKYAT